MPGSAQVRFGLRFLGCAIFALALVGCSRQAYRNRADKDVENIISQKNIFPQWKVQNWHVYPDSRARFADSSNPDFPPYPPDDYAAKLLSPNPQKPGRGGVGRYEGDGWLKQVQEWDAQNRAEAVDPLDTKKVEFPTPTTGDSVSAAFKTEEHAYRLKLDQALELGLYNAREFQDRREDMYLSALPVSLERFQFSAQAFASDQLIRNWAGAERTDASTGWANSANIGFTQRFATGATLMVQLANQIVFNLGNGQPTVGIGSTGLTLVQPFLRGGGMAVTLEPLTQAERTMLYAVRSYARFRSVFYYAVAGGGGYTNNPYGLQGLSVNLGRGVGANLTSTPVGYVPLLLRNSLLSNEQKNVASLEQFLKLFQNLKEGGGVTELQVVRIEQKLLQSRLTVLQRKQSYIDGIDNFKLQLGVPATLPLELDDEPIRPLRDQLRRFEEVYEHLRELENKARAFDIKQPAGEYRKYWTNLMTDSQLSKGTPFAGEWPKIAAELKALPDEVLRKRLADNLEIRRKLLDEKAARQLKGQPDTDADKQKTIGNQEEIDRLQFEQALRVYEGQAWLRLPPERRLVEQTGLIRAAFDAGMLVVIVARNQRLDAIRTKWPAIPSMTIDGDDLLAIPLDDAYGKVAQVALLNRLDLMNARGQVVDAWRQLTVVANSLQGVFDVSYNLNATTPANGNQGLNFSASRMLNQVQMRIEPPFVRRAERNAYRSSLIAYQRQRRNLQAFEDNIVTDSRTDLRTVRQLYQVYLIQQRAIELAYAQVDNAQGTFLAPPDPKSPDTAGTAAALTQQLLDAQANAVQAQNDLFTAWTNFVTARMELFLDLELLTPDARGLWTHDATPLPGSGPDFPPAPIGPERLPPPIPVPVPLDVGGLDPFPPLAIPGTSR
jgi:outer membrane protein TolC